MRENGITECTCFVAFPLLSSPSPFTPAGELRLQIFSRSARGLQYPTLPLLLLDGRGAQYRPDGLIKHRLKATLRQG
uniref:Uncharacterized protein n=1 Tax=Anguilla anguilla TaxID=7936 RepID=A0A0E9X6D2_ANGAN